jgi:dienelactone hydrolase
LVFGIWDGISEAMTTLVGLRLETSKKILVGVLFVLAVLIFSIGLIVYWRWKLRVEEWVSPVAETGVPEKIAELEEYKFENLAKREYVGSEIKLERVLGEEKGFTSYLFSFESDGKRVTGWANVPGGTKELKNLETEEQGTLEKYPVIVMLRGYVGKEVYQTGMGTWKAAGKFAENGYITLAPDFLGYGESDGEDEYPLLARFERPVTVLNLMASVNNWEIAHEERVGIWAHSNGGQVALSVLEITGESYPTTLWAPVSVGFPESILHYAPEMPDKGEYLKGLIKEFDMYYLAKRFSIDNYWGNVRSSIQVHQGTRDEAVPVEWSRRLAEELKSLRAEESKSMKTKELGSQEAEMLKGRKAEIQYFEYPGDDHNFARGNWSRVVARDLAFFGKMLR